MMHLKHPMSVDLHLDQCATKSKLVVARILGGTGYWKYGVEQYSAMLSEYGIPFVALPGDDKPDDELWRLSTVSRSGLGGFTCLFRRRWHAKIFVMLYFIQKQ